MRSRDIIICLVCIVVMGCLLVTAGMQLDFINSQRHQMKLISNEPLENAPPSLAFATVAMGAFRGLVVDILWLRADRLKDEGQFFDAKQLAEWITILQPRFGSVWEFHAWNMAYNISVTIPESQPEERWRWVKNGYELLRDKGIELNPGNIRLYRELSRIFQHKLGGVTDAVHKYYKLQLARSMEPLLSSPDNQLDSLDNQYFKSLAEAATEWEQIIKDANVVPLITALKASDKSFEDTDEFVGNYLALRRNPASFDSAAFDVIDEFRGTEALKIFDIFAKSYQLRKVWKLEPDLMQELNKNYGPMDWRDPNKNYPLDWRHPSTHAIYWAAKGLKVAAKGDLSVEETNSDRIVGHSLQDLFFNGRIFIHKIPIEFSKRASLRSPVVATEATTYVGEVFLRPDLRMFEPLNKARLAVLDKYKGLKRMSAYEGLENGHRNMLRNAVLMFYEAGNRRQAQKIYNQLRRLYPRKEFEVPLIDFARQGLYEDLSKLQLNEAKQMVQMLLRESYFMYAMRDDDQAYGREKMAKEIHGHYQKKYRDENRIDLPDFKLLRYLALIDFLNDWQYPPDLRQSLVARIGLERPELAEQLARQEQRLLKELEKAK